MNLAGVSRCVCVRVSALKLFVRNLHIFELTVCGKLFAFLMQRINKQQQPKLLCVVIVGCGGLIKSII